MSYIKRFRRWFLPLFISYFIDGVLLRGVLATCRVRIHGLEELFLSVERGPCILACWHNRLTICSYAIRRWAPHIPFTAVVSKSGDGNLLAATLRRIKNMRVISVAHNARHRALRQIIKVLREEKRVLLVTPDGPRGPVYRSKPGTIVAAQAAKAAVVTVSWSASRFWKLRSWDEMRIPQPFSKIEIHLSSPTTFCSEESIETRCRQLDRLLSSHEKS